MLIVEGAIWTVEVDVKVPRDWRSIILRREDNRKARFMWDSAEKIQIERMLKDSARGGKDEFVVNFHLQFLVEKLHCALLLLSPVNISKLSEPDNLSWHVIPSSCH